MASSKQDGTAAAAEQLDSLSLGESMGMKDNETENDEDAEENDAAATTLCSACDMESDALKKCRNCKCVWYCDKECQNKHWKEHKKECKHIKKELDKRGGKLDVGTELDVGPLEELPPREECPICMRVLPIHASFHLYSICCGKTICCACDYKHGITAEKRAAERGQTEVQRTCAFCRKPMVYSDEEVLARLSKRVEIMDAVALHGLAMKYMNGTLGMSVDEAKCIDLLRKCASLGLPLAQYQLGCFYDDGEMGLEQNKEEARKYLEKAAEGGYLLARHNLGSAEGRNGNHVSAMRHLRLSASGGYKMSMETLILCFETGFLHHGDLAESIRAFYCARAEMKSKDRDQWVKYLKETGRYNEEYDM